jgi:predicted enzyme related to lactoylglutathione lyase
MAVQSFDIGFVSTTDALVHFYATVLELEEIEPREFAMGVVRRLACGGGVLKVMIPTETPAPLPAAGFLERSGIRYATVWVDDVDGVAARWQANGGALLMGPAELLSGTYGALATDPDGNTVELMQTA